MSDARRPDVQHLVERARVVGRIADHLMPLRPGEPIGVAVRAQSSVVAAEFAADVAAAARLRGRHLRVEAGRVGEVLGDGWDAVILFGASGASGDQTDVTIVVETSAEGRPVLARIGAPDVPVYLFSYGTLQLEDVQRSNFGRVLGGTPDTLAGHRTDWVQITDPDVIAASGTDRHPIVRPTGDPSDAVTGTLFEITATELAAADTYEVDDYRRFSVELLSGRRAWVYLAAEFAASVAE